MSEPTIKDVISTALKLRAQKDAIDAKAKQEVADIKAKIEKLEAYLKLRLDAQQLTQFKCDSGTVFLTTTDYANVADWDATLEFIKENNRFDLLNKAVNKTAVRSFIEESKAVPPGVNYGTKIEVNIRKAAARAED